MASGYLDPTRRNYYPKAGHKKLGPSHVEPLAPVAGADLNRHRQRDQTPVQTVELPMEPPARLNFVPSDGHEKAQPSHVEPRPPVHVPDHFQRKLEAVRAEVSDPSIIAPMEDTEDMREQQEALAQIREQLAERAETQEPIARKRGRPRKQQVST